MTKPIEWTVEEPRPPRVVRLELQVCKVTDGASVEVYPATPSDLVAALAAMPQKEAEQVIRDAGAAGSFDMQSAIIADLRNKLAAAEGCAEACRAETRRADAAWAAEERLHKEATARAEKAERERDEARLDLARALKSNTAYSVAADEAIRDRDAALGERNRAQAERDEARAAERSEHEAAVANLNAADNKRRAVEWERDSAREQCSELLSERDDLRVKNDDLRDCLKERKTICEDAIKRAVAAETAAAQREPESRGCSYTDAVTLFRRDPRAPWTCDELQRAHGPDASCRFPEFEHRIQFTDPSGSYSGPYTPTNVEAKSTTWRRVESKPAPKQREPREYPLAAGSRWEGETIAANGVSVYISTGRLWLLSGVVAMSAEVPDVLALAHRRGLL